MVTKGREELIRGSTRAIRAGVREDEVVIILADIIIDIGGKAVLVVIITDGDDEVRVPAMDHGSDLALLRIDRRSIIPYHRKPHRSRG
jgi:hypothetical protein